MDTPEVGAVVAGAGIAGLAAALELQESLRDVFVVDASDRPGGVMRTDHIQGFVVERGPNTLVVKAPMHDLLVRHGADTHLLAASPAGRRRYVYRNGALVRVPGSPLAFLGTSLLSTGGKLRLLAEPFIRRGDASRESVAEFVGRRLGAEAVSGLVGPFLTGVYAGDENELGAQAVFPGLVDCERRAGSIALGALVGGVSRRGPKGLRGSWSAAEGLGPFARGLAERLVEPPALESRVTGVRRDGDGWLVFVSGPGGERRLRAPKVVLSVPADQASDILRGVDADLSDALASIDYAPIVGVPLGVDPAEVATPIDGFGFLVPRDSGLSLLGCLFMSEMFPGRAPADRALLQCILGGVRWPEAIDLSDEAIEKQLHSDLDRVLGLRAAPKTLAVTRWRRAIPQPGRDHRALVARVRAGLADLPGLSLAGSYLDGVSVADAAASGIRAASEALAS